MATFDNKSFIKHDDYMTPKFAWQNIKQYIPKDKLIWEAFYGDGDSGNYLTEMGFNVIHDKDLDFFKSDAGDLVVSNPPFSKSKEVLNRMVELKKPFIMIMPSSKINTQYFRKLFSDSKDKIQIIVPRKRIQFIKKVDGKIDASKNACNFDCFYYCWKMNLTRDIIWLSDNECVE